jgi:hypothetical protein
MIEEDKVEVMSEGYQEEGLSSEINFQVHLNMIKKLLSIDYLLIMGKGFNKIRMGLAILLPALKLPMRDIMSVDPVLNTIWKMRNILDKIKKIGLEELIESLLYKIITMILKANKADQIVSQQNTKNHSELKLMARLQEKFFHFVFLLKTII